MNFRKIRSAIIALAGVGALSFPVWGPTNSVALMSASVDPTCDPVTVPQACIPEFTIPPAESPTPSESPTPTESPSPSPSPTPTESPTPSASPTPTDAPTPQFYAPSSGCIRAGAQGAGCSFSLTTDHVIIAGIDLDLRGVLDLPTGGPSALPLPSDTPTIPTVTAPSIDPSAVPVPSIDPSALPVPSIDPTALIPTAAPTVAQRRGARVDRAFMIDLVLISPIDGSQTLLASCTGGTTCLTTTALDQSVVGEQVTCILRGATRSAVFGCISY